MKKLIFTLVLIASATMVSSASNSPITNTITDKIVNNLKQHYTTPQLIFSKDKDVRCRVNWSHNGTNYTTGWYDTCAQADAVYNAWASANGRPPIQR